MSFVQVVPLCLLTRLDVFCGVSVACFCGCVGCRACVSVLYDMGRLSPLAVQRETFAWRTMTGSFQQGVVPNVDCRSSHGIGPIMEPRAPLIHGNLHSIPYPTLPYPTLYRTHTVPYCTVPYRAVAVAVAWRPVPCRAVSYHTTPDQTRPDHAMPWPAMPCHAMPYHFQGFPSQSLHQASSNYVWMFYHADQSFNQPTVKDELGSSSLQQLQPI